MLTTIRTVTGGGRDFRLFIAFTVLSAVIQAAAVITLFPLLEDLFGPTPGAAWPWVLLMVAFIAAAWGLDILAAHSGLSVGLSLMHSIHRNTPRAVLNWPDPTVTAARAARLRSLMATGATEVTSAPVLLVGPIISAVVFTFALGAGLLLFTVPVAVVTVAGGVLMLLALLASSRLTTRADNAFSKAHESLDDRLFDYARAQPSLRTARRVSAGARLVDNALVSARSRSLRLLFWQIPGEIAFSLVLQAVLIGFGATVWLSYDNGTLSAVTAAVAVIVMLRVVEQVTGVSRLAPGLHSLNRTLSDADEVVTTATRAPAEPAGPAGPAAQPPNIALRDLGVAFPDGTSGLNGVSLDLSPGSVTVVAGRSGSGKTTLLRTLAGLVAPSEGRVELDGAGAGTPELRGNATMVFQQTALGAGTVRDNLLAVNPDLTDAGLEQLADAAGLRPVLEATPDDWDTPVGELGNHLSGGERQRVGIARGLAKQARLLLVDEATSALDAHNEASVVESIRRVKADYTTVIVTHRPATVAIADTVVVLDGGRVVEHGTPAELEAADGDFARLVREWRASASWRVGTSR